MNAHSSIVDSRFRSGASASEELRDFAKAFGGGFIFAVPLLYTEEMWRIGVTASNAEIVGLLILTVVLNLLLNTFTGFKQRRSFASVVEETIEVLAVGIVAAFVALFALGVISSSDPARETIGRVGVQVIGISIGASVANSVFGRSGEEKRDSGKNVDGDESGPDHPLLNDIGATVIGSVFLILGIAPTGEIERIAGEIDGIHVLLLIALSLFISYGIVFASGFDRQSADGPFQHPSTETVLSYVISLAVATGFLVLLGDFEPQASTTMMVATVVVLGLPATIGGAAGRLVI